MKQYLTRSGLLVEVRGRKRERDGWKVLAYRVMTGGRHGWLWLHHLRPVSPTKGRH